MKPYTKRSKNSWNKKYPITSKETGITYEVRIRPYQLDDKQYGDGSVVYLYSDGFMGHELRKEYFNNNDGKIGIFYMNKPNEHTAYDYNMIEMAKLVVKLYEQDTVSERCSLKQIEKDFTDFKKWDGTV